MVVCKVFVPDGVGLHSKAASCFMNKARSYKSFIWLKYNRTLVNAKNIFEVLSLGVDGGVSIEISADGIDEEQAVAELADFVKNLN